MALNKARTSLSNLDCGYSSKAWKTVLCVYNFFRKYVNEENHKYLKFSNHHKDWLQRHAQYVNCILCMHRSSKRKTRGHHKKLFVLSRKRVTNIDNFKKDVLWCIFFEFYNRREHPTAKKLTLSLKEKTAYNDLVSSMKSVLKQLWFWYKKINNGQKFLLEWMKWHSSCQVEVLAHNE